ncbi:GABA permease GabA [Metarhizium guizhouense ARSEF 977]|uniref:GABA permease GabA n=1 Tax=Metarhizium guizhouense (strain ARSEF 977) TaxID=1276136 RepID=A0A0B4GGM2_METGA|nr:GABA permease GabA [Metarhizium guizhouense ARSEF 977]
MSALPSSRRPKGDPAPSSGASWAPASATRVARRVPVGVSHGRRAVSPGGHRLVQEREPRRRVGVRWTGLTTVLFVFPPSIPVTASNMNYFILAFRVMLLIAGGTWVFDGRRHYQGPQLNIQGLMKGKLEVMEPAMGVNSSNKTQEAMLQGQVAAALL